MGHSTGCQDTVRYAEKFGKEADGPKMLAYILQAPVSFLPVLNIPVRHIVAKSMSAKRDFERTICTSE